MEEIKEFLDTLSDNTSIWSATTEIEEHNNAYPDQTPVRHPYPLSPRIIIESFGDLSSDSESLTDADSFCWARSVESIHSAVEEVPEDLQITDYTSKIVEISSDLFKQRASLLRTKKHEGWDKKYTKSCLHQLYKTISAKLKNEMMVELEARVSECERIKRELKMYKRKAEEVKIGVAQIPQMAEMKFDIDAKVSECEKETDRTKQELEEYRQKIEQIKIGIAQIPQTAEMKSEAEAKVSDCEMVTKRINQKLETYRQKIKEIKMGVAQFSQMAEDNQMTPDDLLDAKRSLEESLKLAGKPWKIKLGMIDDCRQQKQRARRDLGVAQPFMSRVSNYVIHKCNKMINGTHYNTYQRF